MAVKPMLFTGEMVRSISARRKGMTRRVITKANSRIGEGGDWDKLDWDGKAVYNEKAPPDFSPPFIKHLAPLPFVDESFPNKAGQHTYSHLYVPYNWADDMQVFRVYPRWEPGDILWVKETWARSDRGVLYRADDDRRGVRWKSPRFMPQGASRIRLDVTAVRPERVQDITEEDAQAEGVALGGSPTYVKAFAQLWDSINAKRGHGWEANDWVWVLKFGVAYILGESDDNGVLSEVELRRQMEMGKGWTQSIESVNDAYEGATLQHDHDIRVLKALPNPYPSTGQRADDIEGFRKRILAALKGQADG